MTATEKEVLLDTLREQRRHILEAIEGLTDEQLRRPELPSGWTAVDLVQHLALDVERFWFRQVFTGEELTPEEAEEAKAEAWIVPPGVAPSAVLDRYGREIERADQVIERAPLDAPPVAWPDVFPPQFHLDNLRELLLHVITETACHAGHLDATRELIDGRQWLVLTG
ncbi:MAG: DinB family protein [Candidatus Dormibacteraceae bacterium]